MVKAELKLATQENTNSDKATINTNEKDSISQTN